MAVDVIIPTLRRIHAFRAFESLRFIPFPINLHVVTGGSTWAEAINIGLLQTSGENDVILMDDDVNLREKTFNRLEENLDKADIFGFKLLFPDGRIQHAGGFVKGLTVGHIGHMEDDEGQYDNPYLTCHVTTSLCYIKRTVLNDLKGMAEDIPGVQCEDVDFSFRALKKGYRIMYLPGEAIHLQSATKQFFDGFVENVGVAFNEIKKRHLENSEFLKIAESFPRKAVELIRI